MRRRLLGNRWPRQVLVVALVLVIGAVGLCLFDGDEDDPMGCAASFDLCGGLAIFSVGVTLLVVAQVHLLPLDPPYGVYAVCLHRLDPPPKAPALS